MRGENDLFPNKTKLFYFDFFGGKKNPKNNDINMTPYSSV